MAIHSSIPAWRIPWTEEPGGLQSMGLQTVRHPDAGKHCRQKKKGMTEDEMVGWHHRLNGHGFGWTLAVGLACYSSWGQKESDTTERPFTK